MSDSGGPSLEFKIIRTIEEFTDLEEDWQTLFSEVGRGPQLFQNFNWIWHWVHQCLDKRDDLIILTGRNSGELVLIAPLVCERERGIKMIKWIGEPVSQYGDILIKEDGNNLQWLKEGFNFLCDEIRPDLFYLRKIRFDSSVTPLLENYGATIIEEATAPYIETLGAKTFTEFNKRYSQRNRKSKRRHRRKLQEKGKLEFHFYSEGPEAQRATLKAIELKRCWIKTMGLVSPSFNGNNLDKFFKKTSAINDHPAGLKVSELTLDGRTVAIEVGITMKNYYGAHLGAYDPEFYAHSPGSLQMQDTISALIDEGIEVIDLFAPCDQYKTEWTTQTVPVYDFAFPTSILGHIYEKCYLKRLRPLLKAGLLKLSPLKLKTSKFIKEE